MADARPAAANAPAPPEPNLEELQKALAILKGASLDPDCQEIRSLETRIAEERKKAI